MAWSLHLDDALFLSGEQAHDDGLDNGHEGHVAVGTDGNGSHQVGRGLRGQEDGRGTVCSADDGDTCCLVGFKADSQGEHVCTEDTELRGCSDEYQLGIGDEGGEVGHGTDSQEDEWGIPPLSHTLIEDVQDRVVFVEADFKSGIGTERDVAEDDAQSDGDEQQRLKVFLDGEPDEEGSHSNHNEVGYRGIGEARVRQELIEVGYDEFSKRHCFLPFYYFTFLPLSDGDQRGTFHHRVAHLYED